MRRMLLATVPFAVAVACSDYGDADEPAMSSPTIDGGIADAGDAATSSDASLEASPEPPKPLDPTCLAAPTTPLAFSLLSKPAALEMPFAIATDDENVYWLAQQFTDKATRDEAYNGHGTAVLRRVAKDATGAEGTILVDNQPRAIALTVDGDYVVWAAAAAQAQFELRRIRRDCSAPCVPERFASLGATGGISDLRRVRDGVLAMVSTSGDVLLSAENAMTSLTKVGDNATLASTNGRLFAGSPDLPHIETFELDTPDPHAIPLPPIDDAGFPGSKQLATSCSTLFVLRDKNRLDRVMNSEYENWATAPASDVFAMLADERYVYLGSANGLGLHVLDVQTAVATKLWPGSVWNMTRDADGLYWADHDPQGGGSVYVYRTR